MIQGQTVPTHEYDKAFEFVSFFAEEAKQRMCDGYIDMSKVCAHKMADEMISTLHFARNTEILKFWESVKSYIDEAAYYYELQ